jgi:hypothetical protein
VNECVRRAARVRLLALRVRVGGDTARSRRPIFELELAKIADAEAHEPMTLVADEYICNGSTRCEDFGPKEHRHPVVLVLERHALWAVLESGNYMNVLDEDAPVEPLIIRDPVVVADAAPRRLV